MEPRGPSLEALETIDRVAHQLRGPVPQDMGEMVIEVAGIIVEKPFDVLPGSGLGRRAAERGDHVRGFRIARSIF